MFLYFVGYIPHIFLGGKFIIDLFQYIIRNNNYG